MEHKIKLSIGRFEIELSGSEEFVKQYEEKFQLVNKFQELDSEALGKNDPLKASPTQSPQGGDLQEAGSYENVFDFGGNKTKLILSKIPGTSKAEKQVNIALLYLLGEALKGNSRVEMDEIREPCEEYDCYDAANINANLKRKRSFFSIEGKKNSKNKKIGLTKPGENEAKNLAEELNNSQLENAA